MQHKKFEYPEKLRPLHKKGKVLAWLTILYLITILIGYSFFMGHSKIMLTNFFEDFLSLLPPISFLIASKFFNKRPTKNFPYGFHKVVDISYLVSSLVLTAIGLFLLIENSITLFKLEHVSIGVTIIFGHIIWLGYAMMFIMFWKMVIPPFLSHAKLKISKPLHDKILFADAEMNKADWLTAAGSFLGIIGIGYGFWWLDPLVAILISIDILYDGFTNLSHATGIFLSEIPKTVEKNKTDKLIFEVKKKLRDLNWVKQVEVRFREEGHVYFAEAFVVPKSSIDILNNIDNATREIYNLSWKIYDFVIMVTPEI